MLLRLTGYKENRVLRQSLSTFRSSEKIKVILTDENLTYNSQNQNQSYAFKWICIGRFHLYYICVITTKKWKKELY